MNSKLLVMILGPLAAGGMQFGALVSTGVTAPLQLAAGVVGAMATALAGLVTTLPRAHGEERRRRDCDEPGEGSSPKEDLQ